MRRVRRVPLAAFVALLLGADLQAQPLEALALATSVESHPADVSVGASPCAITIRGRHGGTNGRIGTSFADGAVRTQRGWWTRLSPTGGADLQPGDTFSEVVDLDLSCSARRRYRFDVRARAGEGETLHRYELYYPSEDGFTQETVIDLKSLCRFFEWCEPASEEDPNAPTAPPADAPPSADPGAEYDPTPVTLDGRPLEGEWTRSDSNYDPNDSIRIRIEGNRATIVSAPASAVAAFRPGVAVWTSIQSDGSFRIMGSDRRYYPARLTFNGPARLDVDVSHTGPGNDQTWSRADETSSAPPEVPSCSWDAVSGDVWATTASGIPAGLRDALRDIREADAPIQTLALTPDDEWVVVARNVPCYSDGFPTNVRERIDRYIASGREIDVVAVGPGGRWIVVAEDWLGRSGVSDADADQIRAHLDAGRRVQALAFAPDGFVYATDDGQVSTAGSVPEAFEEAVEAAAIGQRVIHEIAFSGDGDWTLVAGDWFVTSGVPSGLFRDLDRYRTDEDRRIDRVVLDPRSGGNRWIIMSNRAEPAPTTPAGQVERSMGASGDSSIWARMKAHDIRGLAMAVIQGNRMAWARGYGLLHPGPDVQRFIYPTTVFDAASVSKPVAAVGALQLMGTEAELTRERVLDDLSGSVVPELIMPALRTAYDPYDEITLARLLSHCSGLDHENGDSGAEAVGVGDTQPSIVEMLFGWSPADPRRRVVSIDTVAAGDMVDYSGANYLLTQALIEARATGGFDGHMQQLFDGLGMDATTYDTPPPDRTDYTQGYDSGSCGGTCPVRGYPNKAAASLTSTVLDLSRFVILLNQGGRFGEDQFLSSEAVDRLLRRDRRRDGSALAESQCSNLGTMGLGMRVRRPGAPDEVFWHRGTHNGFRAYVFGHPRHNAGAGEGSGLVLLMTGDGDDATSFTSELLDSLIGTYAWSDHRNR